MTVYSMTTTTMMMHHYSNLDSTTMEFATPTTNFHQPTSSWARLRATRLYHHSTNLRATMLCHSTSYQSNSRRANQSNR